MKKSKHDLILDPISIGEIILTLEANGTVPTEKNIIELFKELMRRRHDDAIRSMVENLQFIQEEVRK